MLHHNKKAAIELSVGTIVVIVIAMSMLILGLILVKNIFTGATYNVQQLNDKVKGEINKLFADEAQKIVLYVPKGNQIDVSKGDDYGVGFAIKNTAKGESQVGKFTYNVLATSVEKGCQLSLDEANNYIRLGQTDTFDLSPGSDAYFKVVHIRPGDSAPLCLITYDITVTKDSQPYTRTFFDVQIKG